MQAEALKCLPEHAPVDTIIGLSEVNERYIDGSLLVGVLINQVAEDEGIVTSAATGAEARLALGPVALLLCPQVQASEQSE